jgi:hypothetical protein
MLPLQMALRNVQRLDPFLKLDSLLKKIPASW